MFVFFKFTAECLVLQQSSSVPYGNAMSVCEHRDFIHPAFLFVYVVFFSFKSDLLILASVNSSALKSSIAYITLDVCRHIWQWCL